jgi:hypothetical protein
MSVNLKLKMVNIARLATLERVATLVMRASINKV